MGLGAETRVCRVSCAVMREWVVVGMGVTATLAIVNVDTTQSVEKPTRPWKDIVLYGLARVVLFLVLTVVIAYGAYVVGAPLPVMISALLALIVALPLSMFLFKGLRLRVTAEMAAWDDQRRAHREYIKNELEGRE